MFNPESIDLTVLPNVVLPDPERGDTPGLMGMPRLLGWGFLYRCDHSNFNYAHDCYNPS